MYGLAGYFLISSGRDALGNNPAGTPEDWWAGYDTDLGEALGGRYDLPNGVIRRDFSGGTVLLNTPDTPDAHGRARRRLQGSGGRGPHERDVGAGHRHRAPARRRREPAAADRDRDGRRSTRPDLAGHPDPDADTDTDADLDTDRRRRPRPGRRPRPRRKKRPVARVSRVGGKVKITGRVNGASTGSVRARRPAPEGPQVEDGQEGRRPRLPRRLLLDARSRPRPPASTASGRASRARRTPPRRSPPSAPSPPADLKPTLGTVPFI